MQNLKLIDMLVCEECGGTNVQIKVWFIWDKLGIVNGKHIEIL